MVEGARLESVYTPKAYRGFESLPLCKRKSITTVVDFLFLETLKAKRFHKCIKMKKTQNHDSDLDFYACSR